jgi:hypothetical protein
MENPVVPHPGLKTLFPPRSPSLSFRNPKKTDGIAPRARWRAAGTQGHLIAKNKGLKASPFGFKLFSRFLQPLPPRFLSFVPARISELVRHRERKKDAFEFCLFGICICVNGEKEAKKGKKCVFF